MVYEVFQTAVSEELKNRLGDDYEIAIHKIPKNNGTLLDGLTIAGKFYQQRLRFI